MAEKRRHEDRFDTRAHKSQKHDYHDRHDNQSYHTGHRNNPPHNQQRHDSRYNARPSNHQRPQHPPPSQQRGQNQNHNLIPHPTLADLDAKHPPTITYDTIPPYSARHSKTLYLNAQTYPPLLPPLPANLANAPFLHASAFDHRRGELNYERLEFLGDAYLETIATRLIYSRFPELPVGRQSQLREKLVRNSTLAGYARLYGLGDRIQMNGLERQGEKTGEKVLGDVMEAYLGAVVLSEWGEDDAQDAASMGGGFEVAEAWMTALWVPVLLEEDPNIKVVQNRKEDLSRAIGGKGIRIEYLEVGEMVLTKDKSTQQYTMGVYLTGWGHEKKRLGKAVGVNKKEAGMRAAGDALDNCGDLKGLVEMKRVFDERRRAEMVKRREDEAAEKGDKGEGEKDGEKKDASNDEGEKADDEKEGKASKKAKKEKQQEEKVEGKPSLVDTILAAEGQKA